jgi:hypothetical protein
MNQKTTQEVCVAFLQKYSAVSTEHHREVRQLIKHIKSLKKRWPNTSHDQLAHNARQFCFDSDLIYAALYVEGVKP